MSGSCASTPRGSMKSVRLNIRLKNMMTKAPAKSAPISLLTTESDERLMALTVGRARKAMPQHESEKVAT